MKKAQNSIHSCQWTEASKRNSKLQHVACWSPESWAGLTHLKHSFSTGHWPTIQPHSSALAASLLLSAGGCDWLTDWLPANACHLRGAHSLLSVISGVIHHWNIPCELGQTQPEGAKTQHMLTALIFSFLLMLLSHKSKYAHVTMFNSLENNSFTLNHDFTYSM